MLKVGDGFSRCYYYYCISDRIIEFRNLDNIASKQLGNLCIAWEGVG